MNELKILDKLIEKRTMESLKNLGFIKKGWARIKIFNDNTYGWVGLNRGIYSIDNEIDINPVMGVYNEKVHKLFFELMERKPSKHLAPITSEPIGYLMPENKFKVWEFKIGEKIDAKIDNMVGAIERYGLPWMEKQIDWRVLVEIAKTNGLIGFTEYIPPTIWLAYGEKDKALEYGEDAIGKKTQRGDSRSEMEQYKRFLEKIRQS